MSDSGLLSLLAPYRAELFGLAVLLVLWRVIIRPELIAFRSVIDGLASVAASSKAAATTALAAAEVSKQTAQIQVGQTELFREIVREVERVRHAKQ